MVLCADFFLNYSAIVYKISYRVLLAETSNCIFYYQNINPVYKLALLDTAIHTMGAQTSGCASCKRRKIKCDNIRPKCTRCLRAGIDCTGFEQRLRFVNENNRVRRSIAVRLAQSHEFSLTRNHQVVFQSTLR